jgi:hypothetical protein
VPHTLDRVAPSRVHGRRDACHRCGWTQELAKVDRKLRAQFSSVAHFRWLCDECIDDLTAEQPVPVETHGLTSALQRFLPEHRSPEHRSVA